MNIDRIRCQSMCAAGLFVWANGVMVRNARQQSHERNPSSICEDVSDVTDSWCCARLTARQSVSSSSQRRRIQPTASATALPVEARGRQQRLPRRTHSWL